MGVKFSNNAAITLASGISSSATSATVVDASEFPTVGSGDYAYLTIASVTTADIEIVKDICYVIVWDSKTFGLTLYSINKDTGVLISSLSYRYLASML